MTKNLVKIMAVALIVVMAVTLMATRVNATMSFDEARETDTVTSGAQDTSGAATSINAIIQALLTIAQVVGVGVAVIMLIVLAIKYISAAPGDKADIKKHAVPYIVGAVCLFAGAGILQIIETFANNLNDASNAGEGEET